MAWQQKARVAAMGQFVRAKSERMVLIRFDGEPKEAVGKDFSGNEVEELQFPITFWDERSVGMKYKEGEAVRMVLGSKGQSKVFPVSSPPLLRALLEEDDDEPVVGRTFILSHTGTARDTAYKLREVKVPKQAKVSEPEEEEVEEVEEEEPQPIPEAEEQDRKRKEKFMEEVKKRTPKRKKAKEESASEEEKIEPSVEESN